MIPFRESDGIGASLQRVECAWCGCYIMARVCVPSMAEEVSHGMCQPRAAKYRAEMVAGKNDLVHGECLEAVESDSGNGLNRRDADSPALTSAGRPAANDEVASAPTISCPESSAIRENGIPAPVADRSAEAALEPHPSRDPVASSTFSAKPVFWMVTGYDFARSIRWARRVGNSVSTQIQARRARQ